MRKTDLNHIAAEALSHDADILKQVFIGPDTLPHLTQLAQARIPSGAKVTPHLHPDMHEVFVVLDGQGCAVVNGIELQLERGTCLQIETRETHSFRNTGADELVLLYLGLAK